MSLLGTFDSQAIIFQPHGWWSTHNWHILSLTSKFLIVLEIVQNSIFFSETQVKVLSMSPGRIKSKLHTSIRQWLRLNIPISKGKDGGKTRNALTKTRQKASSTNIIPCHSISNIWGWVMSSGLQQVWVAKCSQVCHLQYIQPLPWTFLSLCLKLLLADFLCS